MGWFSSKPKDTNYSRLLESLETGQPVGDILNFGGAEYFEASTYSEQDSSRRWAEKDFAHESQLFPIFIEFDTDSKYKNSIRITYKGRHLGWISKDDAKPLVKILKEHPVWTSIAGVGKISDLGSGTRNLDYGNVLLHVTVYSKGNAGNEWKSPFLHAQKKVNKPKVKPVQHANEQEDFIGLRLQQLAAGKWDRKKLISGETVCFTQFDNELREKLENKAASRGLVVSSSVTKKLSLLVIDANSLMDSAKAKKAIQYGIPISNLPGYILENSD